MDLNRIPEINEMLALQRPCFETHGQSVAPTERPARGSSYRLLRELILGLLLVPIAGLQLSAAEPLRTFDGKHDITRIQVTVVYFVPCDRPALPDWETRLRYYCRRIEQFHAREFQGQSTLTTTIHPQPFVSSKNSTELRSGDRDFIFFQTLEEVDRRLSLVRREQGPFPILLVLSDINWRDRDAGTLRPGFGGGVGNHARGGPDGRT